MSTPTNDSREYARRALDRRWSDALLRASKAVIFGGCVILTLLLTALQALGLFSVSCAWWGGFSLLALFFITYAGVEFDRLAECRKALEVLLNDEKLYEQLLVAARAERDEQKRLADGIRAQASVELAAAWALTRKEP